MRTALRWVVMLFLVVAVLGSLAVPGRISMALKVLAPAVAVVILWWIYRGDKSENGE